MRKLIIALLFLCTFCTTHVLADDDWGSFGDVDGAWDMQKPVTDVDFEKAIETKTGKKKNKKNKAGMPVFAPNQNSQEVNRNDMAVLYDMKVDFPTLMVPTEGYATDGTLIPAGFYRLIPHKQGNDIYLNLYQGNSLIARLLSRETNDDFGAKEITFAKMTPVDDKYLKIVYGCMDYNVEAIILIRK